MEEILKQAGLEAERNKYACGSANVYTLLIFLEEQFKKVRDASEDKYRQELVNLAGLVLFMIERSDEDIDEQACC